MSDYLVSRNDPRVTDRASRAPRIVSVGKNFHPLVDPSVLELLAAALGPLKASVPLDVRRIRALFASANATYKIVAVNIVCMLTTIDDENSKERFKSVDMNPTFFGI